MPVYFTKDICTFLKDLGNHNDREWFNQNKNQFKEYVEKPFIIFVNDLIESFKELDPRIQITSKEAIFRIYKDIRFSQDKTPYKEFVSALISPGGRKDRSSPGFYFEIRQDAIHIYSGVYEPDPKQLLKIRLYIASHAKDFSKLLLDPKFVKRFGKILGEKNKVLPKELKEAAALQALIFNKNFYFMCSLDPELLYSTKLIEEFVNAFIDARALNVFFEKALNSE
ncbi:MAG: DUF2461 domain-containing protein [Saprospiraceae bacterium]|nr:DUF2461 domain-containing protein [Saprospiraceae bacterium]